ncbi:MAG: hypothetical protein U1F33_04145 [Alphaproteobacteria bacterium]
MLREQSSTERHILPFSRARRGHDGQDMRAAFLAFLEDFDPRRFRRDAGYRHRIDQMLQTLSETETTIFCRIYLKLLTH